MLRLYQQKLKLDIYEALQTSRRVLAQLPTGGGKTHVITSIIDDYVIAKDRVIVLVHRRELISQVADKLRHHGERVQEVTAGTTLKTDVDIYVCMVQTVARRRIPNVKLVIIDEAHHATAGQYRSVIDALPQATVIGFTATPCRMDGRGLGDLFDVLITGASVRQLITDGYLVPARIFCVDLPDDALQRMQISGGDYKLNELSVYMDKSVIYGDLVATYTRLAPATKCLVYASSVELSRRYAKEYADAGIAAAHIDGETNPFERRVIIERFRSGEIRVLTNCSIVTEGFDVPDCETIQLVRPTRSLSLYLQMIGRGMRATEGKSEMIILDHAAAVYRHGFPQTERAWTLAGRQQRRQEATPMINKITIDGLEPAPRNAARHLSAWQLTEMSEEEINAARVVPDVDIHLQELCAKVEERSLKNNNGQLNYYWAYKRWRSALTRKPTIAELKWFAKKAQYHHRWVTHQL